MNNIPSFEDAFMRYYGERAQILRYMREAIGTEEVKWQDLTKYNLSLCAEHILSIVTANSARTYFNVLCGLFSKFTDEGIIPCKNPHDVLKAKKTPQQNVALTESELHKIEKYYDSLFFCPNRQVEKDCLTLFLIEAYCGARTCDVEELSDRNITDGKISYISKKTQTLTSMPVHYKIPLLLSRKPQKEYSTMTKNRVIKRVAKNCGITQPITLFYRGAMVTKPKYELLASHSARRTFASVLAAKGAPLAEISQFMGHSSLLMTSKYIKSDTQNASPEALSFFCQ